MRPNPSTDRSSIQVHVHARSRTEVDLVDAEGRLLLSVFKGELSRGSHTFTFDLAGVAPGTCFAVMRTNQGQCTCPFIRR